MSTEKKDDIKKTLPTVVIGISEAYLVGSFLGSALKTMSKLIDDIDEPKEEKNDKK
jgi:hypothetical protein